MTAAHRRVIEIPISIIDRVAKHAQRSDRDPPAHVAGAETKKTAECLVRVATKWVTLRIRTRLTSYENVLRHQTPRRTGAVLDESALDVSGGTRSCQSQRDRDRSGNLQRDAHRRRLPLGRVGSRAQGWSARCAVAKTAAGSAAVDLVVA